jgi:NAD dependent epimerase/dehydratase family enzyme
VVDDNPMTLRALVDSVTAGLKMKRVGNIPPFVINVIVGKSLVQSMVSSFRVRNQRARQELGWAPKYPAIPDALPSVLSQLEG